MKKGKNQLNIFFSLEKIHGRNKLWTQIKDSNGKIKQGLDNIMEEQIKFYEKLFRSEGWDANAAKVLLDNIEVHLSPQEYDLCENNISIDELS